jgi:photosynthetic reaction center H subunit
MSRDVDDVLRILPLGELSDYEVAEGFPDIRSWRVDAADGREVGKVHELLVDVDTMRTRYLDVRLVAEIAASPMDRDVLVPIGTADLDIVDKRVVLPLSAERISLLPAYMHGGLTRAHEFEVRRHFSLGEAASAASATASARSGASEFYDERYDDRHFFKKQRTAYDQAVRIPVSPDDTVVLKKGENGNDEVIIRRPVDQRSER